MSALGGVHGGVRRAAEALSCGSWALATCRPAAARLRVRVSPKSGSGCK